MERFHIAEWYGRPFFELTPEERLAFADHKVGAYKMKKEDIARLEALERKFLVKSLTAREEARLSLLRSRFEERQKYEKPCPFRSGVAHPTCTKPGGVCSLRIYSDASGSVKPVDGEKGSIRALCPYRFHQDETVFRHIGSLLLSDADPVLAGEIGFLESSGNLDSEPGEDVGRIDMILLSREAVNTDVEMKWAAVEIQAVYFSGKEMPIEFRAIKACNGKITMPVEIRRPDYRSSGPKRLMPQLQIKVPTLRRWGKKMAIVVDKAFFLSMGSMKEVKQLSNCDVVWVLVDFVRKDKSPIFHVEVVMNFGTTLESAIDGLTGGDPVSLEEFQVRIASKIGRRLLA